MGLRLAARKEFPTRKGETGFSGRIRSGSYRRDGVNAGMTSSASHWNCSSMTASGVPMGLLAQTIGCQHLV